MGQLFDFNFRFLYRCKKIVLKVVGIREVFREPTVTLK
jgi:hypothetical protein